MAHSKEIADLLRSLADDFESEKVVLNDIQQARDFEHVYRGEILVAIAPKGEYRLVLSYRNPKEVEALLALTRG